MDTVEKCSVVPIDYYFGQKPHVPYAVTDDVSIQSMKDVLEIDHFSVWNNFVAKESLKSLAEIDLALVHRFNASYSVGKEEEDSKSLLHQLFVCLRIIRPTRLPFTIVQYRLKEDRGIDVFSFTHPEVLLNLPESEVLNHLNLVDLAVFRKLAPRFLQVYRSGPAHIRRAIKYYETGYSEIGDPSLQFTVWMIGIEALFSEGDEPCDENVIKERINESIGLSTDIYQEFRNRDLYAPNPMTVGQIVDDMFALRNRFIHGAWIPKPWFDKRMRNSISGQPLNLADVLREAASFVLRQGLREAILGS